MALRSISVNALEGTPSESSGSTEQGDNTLISFREVNDSCYDRLASFSTSDANTLNNNQRETSSTAFGEGVSKSDNFTTDSAPNLQIQSEHTGDTYCQPGEIFKVRQIILLSFTNALVVNILVEYNSSFCHIYAGSQSRRVRRQEIGGH